MCSFSKPKIPAPPPKPVDERKKQADKKEADTKKRLANRKGGKQFLSGNSFAGIPTLIDTITGNQNSGSQL